MPAMEKLQFFEIKNIHFYIYIFIESPLACGFYNFYLFTIKIKKINDGIYTHISQRCRHSVV
jgi:hypothetical protein